MGRYKYYDTNDGKQKEEVLDDSDCGPNNNYVQLYQNTKPVCCEKNQDFYYKDDNGMMMYKCFDNKDCGPNKKYIQLNKYEKPICGDLNNNNNSKETFQNNINKKIP